MSRWSDKWKNCRVRKGVRSARGSAIGVVAVAGCVVMGFWLWWPLGATALVAALALVVMGRD